ITPLDPLRELDLLLRGQQPVAADLVHEQLQGVRGDVRELGVDVCGFLGALAGAVVADLVPLRLDALVEVVDLLLFEVERRDHAVDLRQLEAVLASSTLEQSGQLGLEDAAPGPLRDRLVSHQGPYARRGRSLGVPDRGATIRPPWRCHSPRPSRPSSPALAAPSPTARAGFSSPN